MLLFGGAAVAGLLLLQGMTQLLLLPLLPLFGYAATGLSRQQWWLDGTVLYRHKAMRTSRIDLSHANVEVGYVAGKQRLSSIKVRDPVHNRRMTVPLLTTGGHHLPPDQIKRLNDAIKAGQRWRRRRNLEKASQVSNYLEALS